MLFQCWWILFSIFLGFTYIVAQVNPLHGHAVVPGPILPRSEAARSPRAHAAARAQKGQMIVSTADGYIHLIDGTPSHQGQRPSKRWSVSTGAPMISSFQVQPSLLSHELKQKQTVCHSHHQLKCSRLLLSLPWMARF